MSTSPKLLDRMRGVTHAKRCCLSMKRVSKRSPGWNEMESGVMFGEFPDFAALHPGYVRNGSKADVRFHNRTLAGNGRVQEQGLI